MSMQTINESGALRALVTEIRNSGRNIGFVPTMGNLHAGHHSLLKLARERADVVIASVFVNPTQFGPSEDFTRYPRTIEADAAGLAAQGCDVLFAPTVADLYPYGADCGVRVSVPELADVLEGASRPGHFDGVATVVAKLFNLVQPDVAVFGQKDYQQLLVIRRMVRDLGFPIEIASAPIVRECNGLAMSSRNQYLSAEQREQASVIQTTLQWMGEEFAAARQSIAQIEAGAHQRIEQAGLVVDYAVIRRAADLRSVENPQRDECVALIAARFGSTRLIDNVLLETQAVERV